MTERILFIDTETGGLDPLEYSLLSIGFVVWCDSKILDSVEILINDGQLRANQKSIEINKINLEEHKANELKFLIL